MFTHVIALCVAIGSPAEIAAPQTAGDEPGFVDVTARSGVAGLVAEHYRRVPKWWLSGMMLVDLDADGDLDLHLAGHGSPAAAALNDGKGRFSAIDPKLSIPRGVRHDADLPYPGGEVRLPLDFNEDGRIDLLCSWHDGGGAMYVNATDTAGGAGGTRFARSHGLDVFCRACAVMDVDADGHADLLYPHNGRIVVRRGRGEGTFHPDAGALPGVFGETRLIPIDVNADGHTDLLTHGNTGGNFYSRTPFERRILLADGKGGFVESAAKLGVDKAGGSIHGAGDLNHDGAPDLVCIEGRDVAVYLNDGRGRFRKLPGAVGGMESVRRRPQSMAWGGAAVTDLDNDGLADVLLVGRYFLYVLRGAGGGRLVYANARWGIPNAATASVDEGLCFGDIDGDGMLDLVCCGPGPGKKKGAVVLRNNLPRGNWLRVRLVGRKGNRSAAGAEIRVHSAAPAGKTGELLWCEQVCPWGRQSVHSYYAAARTERHFGLGRRARVDVTVEFRPSGRRVTRRGVQADRTVVLREDDASSADRRTEP